MKLVEKNRLVELLHSCVHNNACFVDESKMFRKAYCGAVNSVGKIITQLSADKRSLFTENNHWNEFHHYLKPILDIERSDRDDVFRKSNKFDRPDFGNNIPFELFSALSNLHLHKQEQEQEKEDKETYPHEEQDFKSGEEEGDLDESPEEIDKKTDSTEVQEIVLEKHDKSHDEVTVDIKTLTQNPPDSQERAVPQEFEVRLKHSRSIEEQVIETRQDQDLIQEREETKHLKEEEDKEKEANEHEHEQQQAQNPGETHKDEHVETKHEQ